MRTLDHGSVEINRRVDTLHAAMDIAAVITNAREAVTALTALGAHPDHAHSMANALGIARNVLRVWGNEQDTSSWPTEARILFTQMIDLTADDAS